jgi:hypothetical protein
MNNYFYHPIYYKKFGFVRKAIFYSQPVGYGLENWLCIQRQFPFVYKAIYFNYCL